MTSPIWPSIWQTRLLLTGENNLRIFESLTFGTKLFVFCFAFSISGAVNFTW